MLIQEHDVKGVYAPQPHERILKVLVSPDTVGSQKISVGLSIIDPGNSSTPHVHEGEEEVFYVVVGRGKVMLENKWFAISPGTAVYVKPGSLHQLLNIGDETLKVLWASARL